MQKSIFLIPFFAILCFLPTNVMSEQAINSTMTYLPLKVKGDQTLHITITSDPSISKDKIQIIKDSILSKDSFRQGEKLVFKGWEGALLAASKEHTLFPIPVNLKIIDSPNNQVEITITLTSSKSDLRYSGYTTFTQDGLMIKKSHIIIYEADKLTDEEIGAIFRHEFGHSLGLGHSSLYGDLMYPDIDVQNSFISQCDEGAIKALYDGQIQKLYQDDL